MARFLKACTTCQSPLHSGGEGELRSLTEIKFKYSKIIFALILLLVLFYFLGMFQ